MILTLMAYNVSVVLSMIFLRMSMMDVVSIQSFVRMLMNPLFLIGGGFALLARMIFVLMMSELRSTPNPMGTVTLVSLSSVVFVLIACVVVFSESFSIRQMIGAVMIFIGVFLVGVR